MPSPVSAGAVGRHNATTSSRVWVDRLSAEDGTVIVCLATTGAVLMSKIHTHEFAYGLITPQTANPSSADRTAGGSGGGSAVAVAAGSITPSVGTDATDSIRGPQPSTETGDSGPPKLLSPAMAWRLCHGPWTMSALSPEVPRMLPWPLSLRERASDVEKAARTSIEHLAELGAKIANVVTSLAEYPFPPSGAI